MKKNLVFIWGMMGAGKSTLGAAVSRRLNIEFIDLDEWIEMQENATISQVFNEMGEQGFRILERECLNDVIHSISEGIIATGGGTPCFYDNAEKMNEAGKTIFLQSKIKEIAGRLAHTHSFRPLLDSLLDNDFSEYLQDLYQDRKDFYARAQHILPVSKNVNKDTEALIRIING